MASLSSPPLNNSYRKTCSTLRRVFRVLFVCMLGNRLRLRQVRPQLSLSSEAPPVQAAAARLREPAAWAVQAALLPQQVKLAYRILARAVWAQLALAASCLSCRMKPPEALQPRAPP